MIFSKRWQYASTIFIEDVSDLIAQWRRASEEVILLIDANQDVYKGLLAKALYDTNGVNDETGIGRMGT